MSERQDQEKEELLHSSLFSFDQLDCFFDQLDCFVAILLSLPSNLFPCFLLLLVFLLFSLTLEVYV